MDSDQKFTYLTGVTQPLNICLETGVTYFEQQEKFLAIFEITDSTDTADRKELVKHLLEHPEILSKYLKIDYERKFGVFCDACKAAGVTKASLVPVEDFSRCLRYDIRCLECAKLGCEIVIGSVGAGKEKERFPFMTPLEATKLFAQDFKGNFDELSAYLEPSIKVYDSINGLVSTNHTFFKPYFFHTDMIANYWREIDRLMLFLTNPEACLYHLHRGIQFYSYTNSIKIEQSVNDLHCVYVM